MDDFASLPPSRKAPPVSGLFQGGMMPATSQDIAAMIIIDLRSLKLTTDQGKRLEAELREVLFDRLDRMGVSLKERSAIDLSSAVFGLSID